MVEDLPGFMEQEYKIREHAESNFLLYRWEWGVYLPEDYARVNAIHERLAAVLQTTAGEMGLDAWSSYSHTERVDNANGLTGGLLFIMIVLDLLLSFATALIMYYKQISEGIEDQKRFVIMRNIGMTEREIRQSIHAQLVWVFGTPLLAAGIHLTFTFGLIHYMLSVAIMDDIPLLIKSMIASFALFTIVYFALYSLTSRTYLNIVNRAQIE